MTPDIERLEALLAKATKGPWEHETEENDGSYGPGPNPATGFKSSMIIGPDGSSLFDALNSTAIIVHEDGPDEDGYVYAWDETSHANAEFIVETVNALPSLISTIRTLQARIDALEAEAVEFMAERDKLYADIEGWRKKSNKDDATIEAQQERIDALENGLRDCADDMESELLAKGTYDTPRKMERDMVTVHAARALLEGATK